MRFRSVDPPAPLKPRSRASHRLLRAAQVLRMHEQRELPVSPLAYREAAEAVCDELRRRSTGWLLQMRLRLPPVVQGLAEDELDVRRALPGPGLTLASSLLQVPSYDEAWRRRAAEAAWRAVEGRLRAPRG